jgi:hypothetical protein
MGRGQDRADGDDLVAHPHVLAHPADVVADGDGGPDEHAGVALPLGQLHHDDGVGARRHGGAGHDPGGLARTDLGALRRARGQDADDVQADRVVLARSRHVGRADGVPVHRRVVEGRDGVLGGDDLGRDAAGGVGHRDLRGCQGGDPLEDVGLRLVERDHPAVTSPRSCTGCGGTRGTGGRGRRA